MQAHDTIQSFIFQDAQIRGQVVHLDKTCQSVLEQHDYPAPVRHLLAQALVSATLLSGNIKFEGEITLQFQGDARLPLLLVQCDHLFNMRAYAKYGEQASLDAYTDAFLKGQLVVTINQYNKTTHYQSQVPIVSTSMAENLMQYFAQSEQLTTRIWLAVEEHHAAGMMLQLMPEQNAEEREHFWEYATELGQTVRDDELLYLDNTTLLHRLYHETTLVLFPSRSVQFRCKCSKDKMESVLRMLGEQELTSLLEERGMVCIHCDFCNTEYSFDPIDVKVLFAS